MLLIVLGGINYFNNLPYLGFKFLDTYTCIGLACISKNTPRTLIARSNANSDVAHQTVVQIDISSTLVPFFCLNQGRKHINLASI